MVSMLSLTEDISLSHIGPFFLSQKNTEEQNTQMSTETLSQPITQNLTATEASPPAPLRMERGVITEIPLYVIHAFSVSSPFLSRPIGVTSHTTPLSIRRGAGGEASPIGVTTHTTSLPAGEVLGEVPAVERRETTSFHSLLRFYQEIYPYFLRRKKRTNRKFIGTQIANIGINAICLLSPNQRKSCRKVLCKT